MEKFIKQCDKVEDEILAMMGNLEKMLEHSSSMFKIATDAQLFEEDSNDITEIKSQIKEKALKINGQITKIDKGLKKVLNNLEDEVPDQRDKNKGEVMKIEVDKKINKLILDI